MSSSNKLIEENEFKIVSGKKKIRRKIYKNCTNLKLEENGKDEFDVTSFLRKIKTIRDDIKISEYFKNSIDIIKSCLNKFSNGTPPKLVCFGIGSFTSCQIALHQFGYLLELCDTLNIRTSEVYDPIFNENECNILEKFDCKLLKDNIEGKYKITELTIIYLPHCPKQLTNNFLWKNWSRESLEKCILICNSFQTLLDNTPERILQIEVRFLFEISDYIQEYSIENNYHFKDIFNDLSVHILSLEKLQNLRDNFWNICKDNEPKYSDLELVTNKIANLDIQ